MIDYDEYAHRSRWRRIAGWFGGRDYAWLPTVLGLVWDAIMEWLTWQ